MSTLNEILASERTNYSARKAEIAETRDRLDQEERRLDMNMERLVEVVMNHTVHTQVPDPRPPITE